MWPRDVERISQAARRAEWRERAERAESERERLQRENGRLQREIAERDRQLAERTEQVAEREKKIADLERQLALRQQNSTTSSKPPSSDGLAGRQRERGRRTKSRRKRGGQPGHPGHWRRLVPAERVNTTVALIPDACRHCQHALHARDEVGDPRRHQVTELPPSEAHITEYRCHRRCCPACGKTTQAPLPVEVEGQFGPQLTALSACLTVVCRMPRLVVQRVLAGALQMPIQRGQYPACLGRGKCRRGRALRGTPRGLAHPARAQRRRNGAPHQRGETVAVDAGGADLRVLHHHHLARGGRVAPVARRQVRRGARQRPLVDLYDVRVGPSPVLLGPFHAQSPQRARTWPPTAAAQRFCREALALQRRLFRPVASLPPAIRTSAAGQARATS